MKYVVILLITLNLLGCNYFDYEKFYSCIESEPVNGRKFSVVVQKNVVKIDGVDKQRCDFEKDTVQFSSDCKNVKIGTFGTLKFITGLCPPSENLKPQ